MLRQFLIRLGIMLAIAAGLVLAPLTLIEGFIGALIGSLVTAVLLRAAAQWVEKRDVPYGDAYLTVTLGAMTNLVASIVLRCVIVAAWHVKLEVADLATALFMVAFGFVVQVVIIESRLRISFDRSCLVCLVILALALVIALLVGGLAYIIMPGFRWEGLAAQLS